MERFDGPHPTAPDGAMLEGGVPCRAVIVHAQPLGMRSATGTDMYAFVLTVLTDGRAPYEVRIGSQVPASAVPLVQPGSTVPARRMADGAEDEVKIDWDAALARAAAAND